MPFSQIHLQYFLFYNSWHINVYPSKRPPSWVRPECCCIFRMSNVTQGGRLSYTRFNFFHRVPRVSRLAYYCGTFWGKILTPRCLPSRTSQVGQCFSSGKPLTVSIFAEIKIKPWLWKVIFLSPLCTAANYNLFRQEWISDMLFRCWVDLEVVSVQDLFLPMIFHFSKVFGPKGHLIRQLLPLIHVDGGIVP